MFNLKRHFLNAAELARGTAEFAQFLREWPEIRKEAPKGDGHPVLVLPPFIGHDIYSKPLRDALGEAGYKTYGWENGVNLGLTGEKFERLCDRVREIFNENGRQKISVIGLSLGGVYARELARRFPDMVRCDISIYSPFGVGMNKDAVPGWLVTSIEALNSSEFSLKDKDRRERLATPPPKVATTSLYSKTDGIAGWQACLNSKSPLAENIEVDGSHMGGFWNPKSIRIILDRLAQPEGKWKPYAPPKETAPNGRAGNTRPFP